MVSPQITFSADETATTSYRWDSGTWETYLVPLTAIEGTHTVEYYSTDTAGNPEPASSRTFEVDLSAPSNPTALVPGEITANTVALSWSASADSVSGVRGYEVYSTTETAPSPPPSTRCVVSGLEPGTEYSLYVKAVDTAGRVSGYSNTVTATTATTDTTPPTTTATSVPATPDGDAGWYVTAPEITLTSDEAATTYYAFGSDEPATTRRRSPPARREHALVPLDRHGRQRRDHQDRGLPSRHRRA